MKKKLYTAPALGLGMACLLLSAGSALAADCGTGRVLPDSTWLMTAPPCEPTVTVAAQYNNDIDFGPAHASGATPEECRTIGRWIDTGIQN